MASRIELTRDTGAPGIDVPNPRVIFTLPTRTADNVLQPHQTHQATIHPAQW